MKIADAVLAKLDRKTLAGIIASYLYFKSRGKKDQEYIRFMLVRRMPDVLTLLWIGVPVIIPAKISDRDFRTLALNAIQKSVKLQK